MLWVWSGNSEQMPQGSCRGCSPNFSKVYILFSCSPEAIRIGLRVHIAEGCRRFVDVGEVCWRERDVERPATRLLAKGVKLGLCCHRKLAIFVERKGGNRVGIFFDRFGCQINVPVYRPRLSL